MTTQVRDLDVVRVDLAVDTLKLLADSTRLRIVWALLHGEHSVNDLAAHVHAQPSTVSQHLSKLRLARLVTTRREGTRIFYLIENGHVRRLAEEALFHAEHLGAGPDADHHRTRHSAPAAERTA